MSDRSPNLDMPYLMPSQAQKHVTHNEALQQLDAIVQMSVLAFDAVVPPGAPEAGDRYALGAGSISTWAGHDDELALWDGTAWQFVAPQTGWRAWGEAEGELRVFQNGNWSTPILTQLGINTSADSTNRLVVSAEATLLTHVGGGHQLKLNKAASGDTASVLYQSGWTGHAEVGLNGDNSWSLKVSPDGTTWNTALHIDQSTGIASGTAVQSDAADSTSGRLLKLNGSSGAFGLGGRGVPENTDLNNVLTSGFYVYDAATANTPTTNGTVVHISRTATIHTQIAISRAASSLGRMYIRATDGMNWSNWAGVNTDQHDILPSTDDSLDIGSAAYRYDNIYATNAAIQTSDVRQKTDIEVLGDAERRVALAVKGMMRKYRLTAAVETKGDKARIHFGIMAQDLMAAFEAEGLNPWHYALLCRDQWWEYTNPETNKVEICEEDPGQDAVLIERLGVRYTELFAFVIAVLA